MSKQIYTTADLPPEFWGNLSSQLIADIDALPPAKPLTDTATLVANVNIARLACICNELSDQQPHYSDVWNALSEVVANSQEPHFIRKCLAAINDHGTKLAAKKLTDFLAERKCDTRAIAIYRALSAAGFAEMKEFYEQAEKKQSIKELGDKIVRSTLDEAKELSQHLTAEPDLPFAAADAHYKQFQLDRESRETLVALCDELIRIQKHNAGLWQALKDYCQLPQDAAFSAACLAALTQHPAGEERRHFMEMLAGFATSPDRVKILEEGAAAGSLLMQYVFGICKINGYGTSSNPTRGIQYLTLAADAGYPDASWCLTKIYLHGLNGIHDDALAFHYCKQAADSGHANAQFQVGMCYLHGEHGFEQDYDACFSYLRKAADQDHIESIFCVGAICFGLLTDEFGLDCTIETDFGEAVRRYSRAIELGSPLGHYGMAYCYLLGMGVPQNESTGIEHFQKAIDLGDANAAIDLAALYQEGGLLRKNYTLAIKYLEQAANLGSLLAMDELIRCYSKKAHKNNLQAKKWRRRRAAAHLRTKKDDSSIVNLLQDTYSNLEDMGFEKLDLKSIIAHQGDASVLLYPPLSTMLAKSSRQFRF